MNFQFEIYIYLDGKYVRRGRGWQYARREGEQ